MDVELQTHTSNPTLALRSLERWAATPPMPAGWRATLVVHSGPFAAQLPFYFDESELGEFLEGVRAMDRTLRGQATLQTPNEEPYLRLEAQSGGRVTVSGLLLQDCPKGQRLEFAFSTDQTVLGPLARDFEAARRALSEPGVAAT